MMKLEHFLTNYPLASLSLWDPDTKLKTDKLAW